jgi:stress-induced morphogen
LQKATADCKAQVKKYAQYNETSWYQRHKMVKSCVKDALEKK